MAFLLCCWDAVSTNPPSPLAIAANIWRKRVSLLMNISDWQRGTKTDEEMRLLSLFADCPNAPFSIHRFVELGAERCGKYPGEWFGPSATALCIQYEKEKGKKVPCQLNCTHA